MNGERYLHKPTGRRMALVMEIAGACVLEGVDRRTMEVSRRDLDNAEVWEKLP